MSYDRLSCFHRLQITQEIITIFNFQGITSWSIFYLIKEKGVLDAGSAAVLLMLELENHA